MRLGELIAEVDALRPGNAFTEAAKTTWVNEVEGKVFTDIWMLSPADVVEYKWPDDQEAELVVPKPYYKLYRYWLMAMMDMANGEWRNYADSHALFNEAWEEYSGWYGYNINPSIGRAELDGYYLSAYALAAKYGYRGTEEEWLHSLKGDRGDVGDPVVVRDMYGTLDELNAAVPSPQIGWMYAIGTAESNTVVGWNGSRWIDYGNIKGPKGERGDRGETGRQGETGPQGAAFTYADFTPEQLEALRGPQGPIGPIGETGATGPQGPQGEKGETGSGFKVLDYYDTAELLEAGVHNPESGDAYGVGTAEPYDIYIYSPSKGWVNNGPLQGAKGDTGPAGPRGEKGESGVYVGSGDMPDGYKVQIDPDGIPADSRGKLIYIDHSGAWSPVAIGAGLKIVNGVLMVDGTAVPDNTTSTLGSAVLGRMILGA